MIRKTVLIDVFFILIGIVVLAINNIVIVSFIPIIVPVVNVIGAIIVVLPPFIFFYGRFKRKREIEEQFIVFVMDLADTIESGMTLPVALKHLSKKSYSSLTPYIKELSAKIDWGISFENAINILSKKTRSVVIKRAVDTIIESYKVGGNVVDTLRAVSRSLIEIDKIKKERSASVHSQIVTSYLIFFVFIFILVILQAFLIPALSTEMVGFGKRRVEIPVEIYSDMFIKFLVIQGFFAGLAIGKMAEGSIVAGFKHSIVLIVFGYTFFSIFSQFKLSLF